VLGHDETLDGQARDQDQLRVLQRQRLAVIAGDHPAQGDAAERVHAAQHGIQDVAAHVLEVGVDAVRRGLLEHRVEVLRVLGGLVVDAGVEAQLVDHVIALVLAAGETHDAAALELGELADHATDRARGGADRHGLAGLGVHDPVQAIPRRHARHADRAQVGRQRNMARVHLLHAAPVGDADLLPAEHADHVVAHRIGRVLGRFHHAHRAADHHLVQRLRLRVRLAVVHAAAHVRIERQEMVAH